MNNPTVSSIILTLLNVISAMRVTSLMSIKFNVLVLLDIAVSTSLLMSVTSVKIITFKALL